MVFVRSSLMEYGGMLVSSREGSFQYRRLGRNTKICLTQAALLLDLTMSVDALQFSL